MKIRKNTVKSFIAFFLSFIMCLGMFTNTYAAKRDANIVPQVIENTDIVTRVRVESENIKYDVVLNKKTTEITINVIENSNVELESKSYGLNLTSIEEGNTSGELCDNVTGKIIELKESNTQSQNGMQINSVIGADIILEGLPKLLEAIKALAIAAGIITVTGVTWYVGTKVKELTKQYPNYQYFQAALVGGWVAVTEPVTRAEAAATAKLYQFSPNSRALGIFCTNQANALALAGDLGKARESAKKHGE